MKLKAVMELTRHGSVEVLARHYIDDRESPHTSTRCSQGSPASVPACLRLGPATQLRLDSGPFDPSGYITV